MTRIARELPPKWKLVKLEDVATLINGRAYKKEELLDSGPMPVLRVGNFFSNRNWYYSDLTLPADKYCNEGDLLFAWSASFGPKIWDGPKAIYHYHIWKIVTTDLVDKKYLFYLLESVSADIKASGNGITMAHATKGGMEQREIPLPPLAEQKKIAAILDAADQLRQKDQQLIDHYTTLSQSLFLEMFGDPVSNPMGWKIGRIEDFCSVQGGLQVSSKRQNLPVGVAYLRVANVYRNSLNLDEIKEMKVTEAELVRVLLQKNDLLVVEGHGNKNEIGRVGVWDGSISPIVHQNHLIRIRVDPNVINHVFLCHYLNSSGGRSSIIKASNTTSGLNTISTKVVKGAECFMPDISIQDEFFRRVEIIDAEKLNAKKNVLNSDALFNSLLQKAFKGELTSSKAA